MEIRLNEFHDNFWCCNCKEKIELGEKYAVLNEQLYDGEVIEKFYHVNDLCIPETEYDYDFEKEEE